MKKKVLIIDDEENIGKVLQNLLKNNFEVFFCQKSNRWKEYLKQSIDLVLLDIWMPVKDGFTILKEIRKYYPDLPVIVMSGHANVSTSVEILKKGANDFIEKPFNYDLVYQKINSLLNNEVSSNESFQEIASQLIHETNKKQRTLNDSIVLTGKGIHKGSNTGVILIPAPPDTGIIFEDISTQQGLEANLLNLAESNFYATTLKKNNFTLTVVEHLLAVLHIYGIDNLRIKVSEEIPIFNGSSIEFCNAIEKIGYVEQVQNKKVIIIDKSYKLVDEKKPDVWIEFLPYDGLNISYTLELPKKFGEQKYEIDLTEDRETKFKKEIAPCRTFGFLEEIKQLYAHGLAKGTNLETGILIDENQVINTKLLFPNEFTRHKILDIIGDLYLFGHEFRGRVIGNHSGHRHTTNLQKKILMN